MNITLNGIIYDLHEIDGKVKAEPRIGSDEVYAWCPEDI